MLGAEAGNEELIADGEELIADAGSFSGAIR